MELIPIGGDRDLVRGWLARHNFKGGEGPLIPADETLKVMDGQIGGFVKVKEEATRRGFKRGSGGKGRMPCPMPRCRGQVTFTVCNANGHIMCACTVKGCLNWIE